MSDKALILGVLALIVLAAAAALVSTHKKTDKAQQECERLGGQLIQARQPYYVCVPKVEGFRETH